MIRNSPVVALAVLAGAILLGTSTASEQRTKIGEWGWGLGCTVSYRSVGRTGSKARPEKSKLRIWHASTRKQVCVNNAELTSDRNVYTFEKYTVTLLFYR